MTTSRLFQSPAVAFLLATFFIAGCGESTPPSAAKEAPRVSVVHPVSRSLTDEADYNGWLEAFKTVDVRARVRGYITKVCFQNGDLVTEGKTPLFEIDDAPFKADLARTEAQVAALKAQETAAKALAERNRILVKTNAVSLQELQESEANAESFGAQIMAKKAEADRIKLDLNYCKIIAPLTGRVGIAKLVEGALVGAGGSDPVLTTIVTVDPVYVDFNVDERAIQRYQLANLEQPGKEKPLRDRHIVFNFGLDTEKGFPHQGELVYVDIDYARGTGTTLVRGIAANKQNLFMPGSRARVRLPIGGKYEAMLVPDTAVCTDQKQKYLLVVDEKKNAKRVVVELGRLLDDGMRVILKSEPQLKPNESIICEGMERARLNYPVEPVPQSAEAVVSTGG